LDLKTQLELVNPRSYDVVEILDNTNSTESDAASKLYRRQEKIKDYIDENAKSMSMEQWERILYFHPSFLNKCKSAEPLKNEKVAQRVDDYWEKKFNSNVISYIDTNVPHFSILPKTKKRIFDSWKVYLNENPEKLDSLKNSIPEFVSKDRSIYKTVISGWKSKIKNDPYSFEQCPYNEIKNNEKILDSIRAFFVEKVGDSVLKYEDVPERLKNDALILSAAKKNALIGFRDNGRALLWNYLENGLQSYLSQDQEILDALKAVWANKLYLEPKFITDLPKVLDNKTYMGIAKNGVLKQLETLPIEQLFESEHAIPKELQNDTNISQIATQKWIDRMSHVNFDVRDLSRVPEAIKNNKTFSDAAINRLEKEIAEYPGRIVYFPYEYQKAIANNENLWKSLLLDAEYTDEKWLELYRNCNIDTLKQSETVQQKAWKIWRSRLIQNFDLSIRLIPKEFLSKLSNDPKIEEAYYSWLKNQVKNNPHKFYLDDAISDVQKRAYRDGFTESLISNPSHWKYIDESILATLLQDSNIRASVFESFKGLAMQQYYLYEKSKIDSPFGDELYKDPDVINAIKENIKTQILNEGKINTPLPELIEEVKNSLGVDDKIDHYMKVLLANPEQFGYFSSVLPQEDWAKLSQKMIDYFKADLIKNKSVKNIPVWALKVINDDPTMHQAIFDAWEKLIDVQNIYNLNQLGGTSTAYHVPPKYVYEDPKIQRLMNVNEKYLFVFDNPSLAHMIPEEYRNHPKILSLLKSYEPKEDNLSYADTISKRTVWASCFNDNIIMNF